MMMAWITASSLIFIALKCMLDFWQEKANTNTNTRTELVPGPILATRPALTARQALASTLAQQSSSSLGLVPSPA